MVRLVRAGGTWVPGGSWRLGGAKGLRASSEARALFLRTVAQDKAIWWTVRAVVEWPVTVAARSSRSSSLYQGAAVGWVAGLLQGAGAEVWYVDPAAWRMAVEVRTPEREPVASLKKADKEAIGDAAAVAEFRRLRRRRRQDEAKRLLIAAGLAKLKTVWPQWSDGHEGVIDAALIALAETQTTSRVGWRRL